MTFGVVAGRQYLRGALAPPDDLKVAEPTVRPKQAIALQTTGPRPTSAISFPLKENG